jgi:beta-phosphoglucomutase-like phosphatase (HAD superfamily)
MQTSPQGRHIVEQSFGRRDYHELLLPNIARMVAPELPGRLPTVKKSFRAGSSKCQTLTGHDHTQFALQEFTRPVTIEEEKFIIHIGFDAVNALNRTLNTILQSGQKAGMILDFDGLIAGLIGKGTGTEPLRHEAFCLAVATVLGFNLHDPAILGFHKKLCIKLWNEEKLLGKTERNMADVLAKTLIQRLKSTERDEFTTKLKEYASHKEEYLNGKTIENGFLYYTKAILDDAAKNGKKAIVPVPGLIELLEFCRKNRIRCIVSSNSHSQFIKICLGENGLDILKFLDAEVIVATDLSHALNLGAKPDGDFHSIAAQYLYEADGIDPANIIVCEDSPNGHRGGVMACVIVVTQDGKRVIRPIGHHVITCADKEGVYGRVQDIVAGSIEAEGELPREYDGIPLMHEQRKIYVLTRDGRHINITRRRKGFEGVV